MPQALLPRRLYHGPFHKEADAPRWHAKTLFRKKQTQQLKENYRTLTQGNLPSEAQSINTRRESRLDLKLQEPGLVRGLFKFDDNLEHQEKISLLNKEMQNAANLSLRYNFGRLLLEKMNRIMPMHSPEDMCDSMRQVECAMPHVMHVEMVSDSRELPQEMYVKTLEHFKETPFWIIHSSAASNSKCLALVKQTVQETGGTVYLEADSKNIKDKSALDLFEAGLTVWVLLVDSYLKQGATAAEQAALDKTIQILLEARDSCSGKYVLLKMQNRPQDIDFIQE